MYFLFAPPQQAVLPVVGDEDVLFPINRVYCVGHNYANLDKELKSTGEPVIFIKPADTVVPVPEGQEGEVPFPPMSDNFQHEIEMVVALKKGGRNLTPEQAHECIYGYGAGIDFTRRDRNSEMREKGQPWEKGKICDLGMPVTAIRRIEEVGTTRGRGIWLDVNGERKQEGNTDQMMFTPEDLIAHLSTFWELKAGDIVFTGTPKGVSAVKKGDVLTAKIDGVADLKVKIV